MRWRCPSCGDTHDDLPLAFGPAAPDVVASVPEEEREQRVVLSTDQCIVDGQHFFVLGNLELPIIGHDEPFSWDIWVSLSAKNFQRASELWTTQGREAEPPYFGWVSSRLPGYPSTHALASKVHTRAVGLRPYIELQPTDHPLSGEQRRGITWARVHELVALALHGAPSERHP
jgi:hypothetical protein